jgi:hypothetical protein
MGIRAVPRLYRRPRPRPRPRQASHPPRPLPPRTSRKTRRTNSAPSRAIRFGPSRARPQVQSHRPRAPRPCPRYPSSRLARSATSLIPKSEAAATAAGIVRVARVV